MCSDKSWEFFISNHTKRFKFTAAADWKKIELVLNAELATVEKSTPEKDTYGLVRWTATAGAYFDISSTGTTTCNDSAV